MPKTNLIPAPAHKEPPICPAYPTTAAFTTAVEEVLNRVEEANSGWGAITTALVETYRRSYPTFIGLVRATWKQVGGERWNTVRTGLSHHLKQSYNLRWVTVKREKGGGPTEVKLVPIEQKEKEPEAMALIQKAAKVLTQAENAKENPGTGTHALLYELRALIGQAYGLYSHYEQYATDQGRKVVSISEAHLKFIEAEK